MRAFCISLILCLQAVSHFGQTPEYVCLYEAVDITPLASLNTSSIEFSPVYYGAGIVYVTAREKSRLLDQSGHAYFDLMYADLGPDGLASKGVNFSPNIRTQYHEGPCTFSADGLEMYFTRSNLSGGTGVRDDKGNVQLKIYGATKGEEDWENIAALSFTSDRYATMHPALSHDGMHMIFASDMPGGYGGMDLYIVSRSGGAWSEPVNLGVQVNTRGNEVFPWWHRNGYLFFSSDGRRGMGGLDLYVTAMEEGMFTASQHLAAPFNSRRDDLGLIVSPDGTSGYFASDRKPGRGRDDLYRWQSPRSIFCRPVQPALPPLREIYVTDAMGSGISAAFVWLIPMGTEGPVRFKEYFTPSLAPGVKEEGTFYLRWNITDTLSAGTADAISDMRGKAILAPDARETYVLVAQHNAYEPFVEVVSGSDVPENIILHKKPERDAPPPLCFNTRFTLYNASGELALNGARIELTGSCFDQALSFYTDENGDALQCLPGGCTLKGDFMQEGYAAHSFTFTPAEEGEHWKIYLSEGKGPASPIVTGTVIVLDNIYYDFNKSAIRKSDAGELAALADVLKQYPALSIELTSHTDTRGSADYNMELSAKRSESARAYLVLLGIDPKRIATLAVGETRPRNHCLDGVTCTEEEHQYNRRTEVRITNPAQGMEVRYKETKN